MPTLRSVKVDLKVPGIAGITGEWTPDRTEQEAAWELYVELATRIALVRLETDEGTVREALNSLYSLFDATRGVLTSHGPAIGKPKGGGTVSLGYISVAILNGTLRPFLGRWHPALQEHEANRPINVSAAAHERSWNRNQELRDELEETRSVLREYAEILAEIANVDSLIPES